MDNGQTNILRIRVISVAFVVAALAVFKPFGLESWQWYAYVHLLIIFALGVAVCMVTDFILDNVLRMPDAQGDIHHFIHRNLVFQLLNTLLESVMICVYRHCLLSNLIPENKLSWGNFFETLVVIAFCSFTVGLFWRFKFRNNYLAAELEEERMLNSRLQALQRDVERRDANSPAVERVSAAEPAHDVSITLTGTTSDAVTLMVDNLLYVEAEGNYSNVYYLQDGEVCSAMLRATSKQVESELQHYPTIVRCHRAFLVNLVHVERVAARAGAMQLVMKHGTTIPVSRSNIAVIKAMLTAH